MRTNETVRCVVTKQGGPILNKGYVVAAGENIAAIEIDMRSKRCEVMAESATEDGAPVIWLCGTTRLHLKKGYEEEQTEVVFPDYKGWKIFSAYVCRYTFRVCFVRNQTEYLFLSEIPEDSTDRDCPKCGDCLSVNWKDGKPYIYCIDGCNLTAKDFEDNAENIRTTQ